MAAYVGLSQQINFSRLPSPGERFDLRDLIGEGKNISFFYPFLCWLRKKQQQQPIFTFHRGRSGRCFTLEILHVFSSHKPNWPFRSSETNRPWECLCWGWLAISSQKKLNISGMAKFFWANLCHVPNIPTLIILSEIL